MRSSKLAMPLRIYATPGGPRLAPLLEGLDDHLRTAKSHHTVRYTERSVIATTASRRSLEYDHDHLIDLVLEGVESTLACMLALRQALDQAGVDVDDEALPEGIGIPLVELVAITLSLLTGVDTQVTMNDDEILVEVVGPAIGVGVLGCRPRSRSE
jgi:hypothetical protein